MKFVETPISGAYLINQTIQTDDRGGFARNYCKNAFIQNGLSNEFIQSSESWNHKKGTLRGMHFQHAPFEEIKLVRCLKGELFDVLIDLRTDSPTYLKHFSVQLSAFDGQLVYLPKGVAHGYLTLTDDCIVGYSMLEGEYSPAHADGVRWNDPRFSINWPFHPKIISSRDDNYPDYKD